MNRFRICACTLMSRALTGSSPPPLSEIASRSIHQKGPRPVTSRSDPPAVRAAPGRQQSRPEGKAVKAAAPNESWRRALKPGDEGEVQKWVEQSGLERVARIVASLSNARVGAGRTERPDRLLLFKMAFLVRQHPERSLHSIASEVARGAGYHPKLGIALESLRSKLERDFKQRRHVWLSLTRVENNYREFGSVSV
jgi:hypothetical protein